MSEIRLKYCDNFSDNNQNSLFCLLPWSYLSKATADTRILCRTVPNICNLAASALKRGKVEAQRSVFTNKTLTSAPKS